MELIELNNNKCLQISWENLEVFTNDKKKKVLLNNLSGNITGGFTAIMGASGSGKSTLLNTLSYRMDRNIKKSGFIYMNNREYTHADFKSNAGYVMQKDILNPDLTVEETLYYNSKLRLPNTTTEEDINDRVNYVIHKMGLENTKNTIVGSPLKKGISGGECKRLCIAIELLNNPKLLFLDEPTSGLDAGTALSVCTYLKKLSQEGINVVCTIHQPPQKVFSLFDNLILLDKGEIIYMGLVSRLNEFYSFSGFPIPNNINPADYMIDILTDTNTNNREKLLNKYNEIKSTNSRTTIIDEEAGIILYNRNDNQKISWNKQFKILFERSMKEQWRKRTGIMIDIFNNIIIALLLGGVFYQVDNSQRNATLRSPFLFFCCINQGLSSSLSTVNSFPEDRVLSLHERRSGTYKTSAYFMAKMTAESLIQMIKPILFSCIVYFMVGLHNDAANFFIFMGIMILCSMAATSLALMISALCKTATLALKVLAFCLEVSRLFGGFFLEPSRLPLYFSWLDALSFIKYAFVSVSLNEYKNVVFTCPSNSTCPIKYGEDIISMKGYDYINIGTGVGILILYIIIMRFIAYIGLRFNKH